ncbi:branched-chain amino acid ABC transporter permease [Zwartia sp.]|uniref:branched-chain amino acid ABC transporter permease n=1 Tax=Zwartia sp. TaxID=2978004 RepID=UPI003BAF49BF
MIDQIMMVLVDGINYSAWLFLAAVGLTLIYGVMKIVNVAHGSFYALGAYVAASVVGAWVAYDLPPALSYVALFVSALLAGFIVGPLVERLILRYQYEKDEVVILLITYAIFLVLEDVLKLIWGVDPYFIVEPYAYLGNFEIGGMSYPNYYLLMLGLAIAVGIVLTYVLKKTNFGRLLVSVIHDREVSAAMGIDVSKIFVLTFGVGCALAGIAGAFTAPTTSVTPGMGVEVIVLSFAVVVTGGLGSLPGVALAAIIMGIVRAFCIHYIPQLELFVIFSVMALVLAFRPRGLFSLAEARKI